MSSFPPETLSHIRYLEQRIQSLSQELQQSTQFFNQEKDRHAAQIQEMELESLRQLDHYRKTCIAFQETVREREEARNQLVLACEERDRACEQRDFAREQRHCECDQLVPVREQLVLALAQRDRACQQRELAREQLLAVRDQLVLALAQRDRACGQREIAREQLVAAREARVAACRASNSAQNDELVAKLQEELYVARQSIERLGQQLVASRVEREAARDELERAVRSHARHSPVNTSQQELVELTDERDRLKERLQSSRDLCHILEQQHVNDDRALPAQAFHEVLKELDEAREELEQVRHAFRDVVRERDRARKQRDRHGEGLDTRAARNDLARTHARHPSDQRATPRLKCSQQLLELDKKRLRSRLMHQSSREQTAEVREAASQLALDCPSVASPTVKPEESPLVVQAEASGLLIESDMKTEEPVETCDAGPSWNRSEHDQVPLYNCEMTVSKEEDDEASDSGEQTINLSGNLFSSNYSAMVKKASLRPLKRKAT